MLKVGNSEVRIQVGARDFCPKRPEWLWGSTSLLFNGYRVISRGQNAQGERLTIHFHLVPRLGISGAIPPLPYMPSWRGKGKVLYKQINPLLLPPPNEVRS